MNERTRRIIAIIAFTISFICLTILAIRLAPDRKIEEPTLTPVIVEVDSSDIFLYEYTIDFIKDCEGYMPLKYLCPANVLTIGYGHTLKSDDTITWLSEDQADSLLRQDFDWYMDWVLYHYPDHEYNQVIALAHFAFCCGHGALQQMYRERNIYNCMNYKMYRNKKGEIVTSDFFEVIRKFNVDMYDEHPFK